jgi:hypothetical protein
VLTKAIIILSAALVLAAAPTARQQEGYPNDDSAPVDRHQVATNPIEWREVAVGSNHGPAGSVKPWPAPVGHRQPRADDLRVGIINEPLANDRHGMGQMVEGHDKAIDDAQHSKELDHAMRGICRGC